MQILLAEDQDLIRESIAEILESRGHTVVAVERGDDALAALMGKQKFDLIISDNQMPGLKGVELLQAFCRWNPPGGPRFVLMSSENRYDNTATLEEVCTVLGATFINKMHSNLGKMIAQILD